MRGSFGRVVVWIAILALAAGARAASAADRLRVGKPSAAGFEFALLEVGTGTGIFARHGLQIDTVTLAGGAKVAQAMASRSLDLSFGGGTDFAFIVKGVPEMAVAAMAGRPLNMGVFVRPGAGIDTVDDLKGRTVGCTTAGSLTMWLGQELARRKGWGENGINMVAVGSLESTAAMVEAGSLDAFVSNTEGGYRLEAKGRVKLLLRFDTAVGDFLSNVILATDDIIASNPDAVRRFLASWFETVAYARAHKDETLRLTQPVTQLPPELGSRVYDEQMPMFFADGHFARADVDAVKRSLVELGVIGAAPDDARIYTEKFLP
jgi:NitT/TauT family transport system substrate-binding protein